MHATRRFRIKMRPVIHGVVAIAVVGLVFFFALPKIADFSSVWKAISNMTWQEEALLLLATGWNIVRYWFVMKASLPGLNYWQAMKVNLSSTAVANTVPGGSALGIAVTTGMFVSYGFTKTEIGLSVVVTGVWNNFVKLGMPVVALALLAI